MNPCMIHISASLIPTMQFLIAYCIQNGVETPSVFYHVNDISIYLGRQREVPHRKNELEASLSLILFLFFFLFFFFNHLMQESA